MKIISIFLAILFTASTGFARSRSILVEVSVPQDGNPKVNIYSSFKTEQRLDANVVDAVAVLERASQPQNTLFISILISGSIQDETLWKLIDALRKNPGVSLDYLEVDRTANFRSSLSERGKELQTRFKVPAYTKSID